jgi:hypothetical protein
MRIKHYLFFSALLLISWSCASKTKSEAETGAALPEVTDGATESPEMAALGTDPFLATDPNPPATLTQTDPLLASDPALPSPTPPRGDSSIGLSGEPSKESLLPPIPEPPPLSDEPQATGSSDMAGTDALGGAETPTAAPMPPVQPRKSLRKEYREFRSKRDNREADEQELADRALFFHEDGAQQLQIDFQPGAFSDFDFDPGTAERKLSTKGGKMAFLYYPLRSINTGRLGVGLEGGAFWAKYSFTTGSGSSAISDSSTKLALYTYGLKAVYEAQFLVGQVVVPFAAVGYERVNARPFQLASASVNLPKRRFYSSTYGAGLLLNLNRLESDAASRSLGSTGIKKFYLAYTYLRRSDDFNAGDGHALGLRFEF